MKKIKSLMSGKFAKKMDENSQFSAWLVQHQNALNYAKRQLVKSPFATIMTVLVIAIALALPSSLLIILNNLKALSAEWDHGAEISVFLKLTASQEQAQSLQVDLQKREDIAAVRYVSPAEGLKLFEKTGGFGDVLEHLGTNPLPAVLKITPRQTYENQAMLEGLMSSIQNLPQVDAVKLDMQWLQRLNALISLGQRIVTGIAFFLVIAVWLIISNTLRLMMENYRSEIEVLKLIGGTLAYIRRPFLYMGAAYGLLGALIALWLTGVGLLYIQEPVNQIANLYQSEFGLSGFNLTAAFIMLSCGALLGYLSARLVIGRHLREIEPR